MPTLSIFFRFFFLTGSASKPRQVLELRSETDLVDELNQPISWHRVEVAGGWGDPLKIWGKHKTKGVREFFFGGGEP